MQVNNTSPLSQTTTNFLFLVTINAINVIHIIRFSGLIMNDHLKLVQAKSGKTLLQELAARATIFA
jgi:hypothetical protein